MYVAWPHAFFINRRTPNARVSISGRRYNWLLRSRDLLRSIVISTSLCLSVRKDISGTTCAIFTIFVHVVCGSVLLRRRCDTLCTSGFLDNIMYFSIMGRIAV